MTDIEKTAFDFPFMLLCSVRFSALLIGSGNIGPKNLDLTVIPFLIGAVTLVLLVKSQINSGCHFLVLRILKQRDYRLSAIFSMHVICSYDGRIDMIPTVFPECYGESSALSGLIMMPGSFLMAVISPLTGKIYNQFGIRKLAAFVAEPTSVIYILLMYRLFLSSIGCFLMPMATWRMSGLEPENTSHGTALCYQCFLGGCGIYLCHYNFDNKI